MKTSVTLPFLFICGSLAAQPTMTAADAPAIGEQFTYYGDGLYMILSSGGAAQTWDFSGSAGTIGNTFTTINASAGTSASFFPDADVALSTTDYQEYIGITTAGLEHMGQHAGTDNIVYTNPELYLPIPCVFGQTWTDDFAGEWSGGATTFTGTTTATASGYGTLILPSITLTNVLRVDQTWTRIESNGITAVRTMNVFYRPGTGYFLASNERLELFLTASSTLLTTSEEFTYLDPASIGIAEAALEPIGLTLMPVPATDHVTLVFGTGGAAQVKLIDAEGRTVITKDMGTFATGIHRYGLDLTGIPAGIYLVQVANAKGERGTQRLVVQR